MSTSLDERQVREPNRVLIEVRGKDGLLKQEIHTTNLRTNAGADWQAQQMSGALADRRAIYIALTADTTQTIAVTATTLTGEATTDGLARAAGTFAHAGGGATSYTVQKQFTYTGAAQITITRSALFAAASGAPMVFFAAFGATATLVNGDQLTVTWTISI